MNDDFNTDVTKAIVTAATSGEPYKDALQPVAKQLGKSLETGGRAVNLLLTPLEGVVWTGERIVEWVKAEVGKKIERTPQDEVVQARVNIAAPAIEAARYTSEEPDLQDMFANLLATAIDRRVHQRALPAFVEILKQLTSDEAKILRIIKPGQPIPIVHIKQLQEPANAFGPSLTKGTVVVRNISLIAKKAGCELPGMVQSYLDNLERLALVKIFPDGTNYSDPTLYDELKADPEVQQAFASVTGPHRAFIRSGLELTTFGRVFLEVCVWPYERHNAASNDAE